MACKVNGRQGAYLSAGLISAILASLMLWIGLTHNPQGEFYGSELGVNWFGIMFLWSSWFAMTFGIQAVAIWLAIRLGHARQL